MKRSRRRCTHDESEAPSHHHRSSPQPPVSLSSMCWIWIYFFDKGRWRRQRRLMEEEVAEVVARRLKTLRWRRRRSVTAEERDASLHPNTGGSNNRTSRCFRRSIRSQRRCPWWNRWQNKSGVYISVCIYV